MARRISDLSVARENDVPADLGPGPKIAYANHKQSLPTIPPFFPRLKEGDLPDEQGWAVEQVNQGAHNGAHPDAPWRFHPTMNGGDRASTIDEVPLEWRLQPGVKPDFRHFADGCGMGAEATLYLLRRGVRLTGTEAWSWDAPFAHSAKKQSETHDASLIWEGHKAGRHIGYCNLEKLHNLEALPATGFMVARLPVKIKAASAGWTRAAAIVGEGI